MIDHILGIIPARYGSKRFPGKPLALLGQKPLIRWVYEHAASHFRHLVVATDDERILDAVRSFGGRAVMTSPSHGSGTERCAEAYRDYAREAGREFSHIVNIQGDEPLAEAAQFAELTDALAASTVSIATLIRPLETLRELEDPNTVKVVVDVDGKALYFSRSRIPHIRDAASSEALIHGHPFYGHVGLYAFRSEVLPEVAALPPAPLEKSESLEQLRWLSHGYSITTRITRHRSPGVDTPEDLERLQQLL